jgi:hypothetical protein
MIKHAQRCAKILFLACFFVTLEAAAQPGMVDRVGSVFDALRERLNQLGEKTDVVGPSVLDFLGSTDQLDLSALVTQTRMIDQQYAANKSHTVSLTTQFGAIRVHSWENQVIRVVADISASAHSIEMAEELTKAIMVNVAPGDRFLQIRTIYPDTRALGQVDMKVNYDVYVPRDANVVCKNDFGDTEVRGIGGTVSIDALGGMVILERIEGAVTVRARGEYPLRATGLLEGGRFVTRGATAQFTDIGGALDVSSIDGMIELRSPRPELRADIVSANGPVHIYLAEGARPAFEAILFGGEIRSDGFPLDYPRRGNPTHARITNPQATQFISVQTSFHNVYLERVGEGGGADRFMQQGPLFSQDLAPMHVPCPDGFELVIAAMPGNIRIEGDDIEEVIVSATKIVRVERKEDADRAFGAFELRIETEANRLEVRSAMIEETSRVSSARMDMLIRCPRTVPIQVRASRGLTTLEGTGSVVSIWQGEGSVRAQHHKGPLTLTNQKGDVDVSECEGPVTIQASYGAVDAFSVFGKLDITCFQGTTKIEAAQGEVVSRSQSGDVRVIATELIGGNYDIAAEGGSISIILSPSANATINARARKGTFHNNSPVPFAGTKIRDTENFSGRLNEGLFNMDLTTVDGDIFLTQQP